MIDSARRLIDLGLPIIPICPHNHDNMTTKHIERCKCAGKTPLIRGWQNKDSTSYDNLHEWIRQFKTFNIGLPLGQASGYCGIDVDGQFGEDALLKMSGGDLPESWEFITGAGRRIIYSIPPGTQTKKYKDAAAEGGHQECAILCDGQQTVMPPSIHITGRLYAWAEGHSPWELDCAEAPRWLIQLIKLDDNDIRSKKFSMDLTNVPDIPAYSAKATAPALSVEDEFLSMEFDDSPPPESQIQVQVKAGKQEKTKTGHKITVSEEMLTSMIPEGQRDNSMTAIVGHYCANRDLRRMGKQFVFNICQQHNLKYCDPPLEEQSILDKVMYFFDIELMKDSKYKAEGKEEKPQFEASKMAAIVIAQLKETDLILRFDQNSKMYYYTTHDKGPWTCTNNNTLINKWIRQVLIDKEFGHPSWDKQSFIEETRRAIEEHYTQAFKYFDDFDLGSHSDKLSKYIICKNGMLDWEAEEIVPWSPDVFTTVSFDVDYDPDAICPRFEGYVKEWLPNESVRKVLQEYMGYCLIPNTKFRKALFMYGKGKNGKSMLLEFLQVFFGDHRSTLSYDALFQRFGPANLKGKMVNIFDDTTVTFAKDTGIVKNLIAGGTVAAEFKGRDHFTFTNIARFIFSAQETPKTSDHSDAWYDRWIFVKFPNKFKPSNAKKTEMQQAMEEERSGIFNWMLEGLRRLIANDEFTLCEELLITSQEYRGQNDSVALFVTNLCVTRADKGKITGTSINKLYKVYCTWSECEGLHRLSKRTFTERLEDLGYSKIKGYADGVSGQSVIKDLYINTDGEDYKENALEYAIALQSS